MHADRRRFMLWGSGGVVLHGLTRPAHGQTAAPASAVVPPPAKSNPINAIQPKVHMQHARSSNVVMLAELTVKPGLLEDFLDYTTANLQLSRSACGNLAFDILLDDAQPDRVVFYEVWESPKAQQDYMAWRVQAGDLTKLLSFLTGEPRFTRLRSIVA